MDSGIGAMLLVNGLADQRPVVRDSLSVLGAWRRGEQLPELPPVRDPEVIDGGEGFVGRYQAGDRELVLGARNGRVFVDSGGVEVALVPDEDTPDLFVVPHPALDRFHLKLEREAGDVVALINGPDRYVRDGREEPPSPPPRRLWVSFAGHYRTYNPWAADFRVYLRGDRFFLSWPDGERELEVLDDGEFRVGESWSPDRLRFETIVEGRPQQAVYNGHPYWRSFAE
jgi:hypothetical protein